MKLGFLGCGKMASALIGGVVQSGAWSPAQIYASSRTPESLKKVVDQTGIQAVSDNATLATITDALILCVKPSDACAVIRSIQPALAGKLIVSIAAGLSIAKLQEAAGPDARVIRVMPNTPSLVHQGAAAYAVTQSAMPEDIVLVVALFSAVGKIVEVKETLLDAVTGVSGSGPAYIYLVIEALADGGVLMGLPRELALSLAAQTVAGAAAMVLQTGLHPATLKDQVASPGGTTIAGLEQLEKSAVRAGIISAVRATTERSKALTA
jgi:pyrroline-5-carboxylate reductase